MGCERLILIGDQIGTIVRFRPRPGNSNLVSSFQSRVFVSAYTYKSDAGWSAYSADPSKPKTGLSDHLPGLCRNDVASLVISGNPTPEDLQKKVDGHVKSIAEQAAEIGERRGPSKCPGLGQIRKLNEWQVATCPRVKRTSALLAENAVPIAMLTNYPDRLTADLRRQSVWCLAHNVSSVSPSGAAGNTKTLHQKLDPVHTQKNGFSTSLGFHDLTELIASPTHAARRPSNSLTACPLACERNRAKAAFRESRSSA